VVAVYDTDIDGAVQGAERHMERMWNMFDRVVAVLVVAVLLLFSARVALACEECRCDSHVQLECVAEEAQADLEIPSAGPEAWVGDASAKLIATSDTSHQADGATGVTLSRNDHRRHADGTALYTDRRHGVGVRAGA